MIVSKWTKVEVKALRSAALRLTQELLAERTGFRVATIRKWERATTDRPVRNYSVEVMSNDRTWDDFVPEICDIAFRYGASTHLSDGQVIVSSRTPRPRDQSARSILITRFDDEAARIRTGWCIDGLADYTIGNPGQLSHAASLIDGICAGGAEEHAFLDIEGRWTGVAWLIRSPQGDGMRGGDFRNPHPKATHRLESWRDATD